MGIVASTSQIHQRALMKKPCSLFFCGINDFNFNKFIIIFSFLISFCLVSFDAHSQWYDPEKVDEKAQLIYESAYELAIKGEYLSSINKLNEAISIEPKYVEAFLSRAGVHASLKNYKKSVEDFETGIKMDSVFSTYYLLPYLSLIHI